jgi:hypothetical protein
MVATPSAAAAATARTFLLRIELSICPKALRANQTAQIGAS